MACLVSCLVVFGKWLVGSLHLTQFCVVPFCVSYKTYNPIPAIESVKNVFGNFLGIFNFTKKLPAVK